MAYVTDTTEAQQATQPGVGTPVSAGGQGGTAATSKTASTAGINTPQQPSAQLSAYINANQPQAQNLASNVASTIGGNVQNAQNAVNQAQNAYTTNLYTAPTNAQVNQQIATAPSQLTPQQTQAYQTELAAASNAPSSTNTFEASQGYQNATQNVQNAVNQANAWNASNSPASLSTALTPFEPATATQGDTTLDALLLSQNPQAYSTIQQAGAPAANLQGNLTTATTTADQALQNAIAQDTATTQAANQAAQGYATNLTNYLNQATQNAQNTSNQANAGILADIKSGNVTPQDLQTLGVTQGQWNNLQQLMSEKPTGLNTKLNPKPITLSNYLTQTAPNITSANVATPKQYADVAALQNILGTTAPVEPINATTASQAGVLPTAQSLNQFNVQGAEVAALQNQAQKLVDYGNYMNQQYSANHAGGMSPGDFNAMIANLNSQIQGINKQIQGISSSGMTSGNVSGVVSPSGGGPNATNIALGIANPVAALANIPLLSPISSVAKTIGGWLGLDEGGEVPEAKRGPMAVATARG